jgi:hypothetical protein
MFDLNLILGVGALLAGVPMVLKPGKARQDTQRAWQRRVAELESGAEETFFEEHRTLKAYPPLSSNGKKRAFGVFLVAVGASVIVLSLLR